MRNERTSVTGLYGLKRKLGRERSLRSEEEIGKTVRRYLDSGGRMDCISSGEYENYIGIYVGR